MTRPLSIVLFAIGGFILIAFLCRLFRNDRGGKGTGGDESDWYGDYGGEVSGSGDGGGD